MHRGCVFRLTKNASRSKLFIINERRSGSMKKDKTERTKQSWRKAQNAPSLSEVNNSVAIPKNAKFFP